MGRSQFPWRYPLAPLPPLSPAAPLTRGLPSTLRSPPPVILLSHRNLGDPREFLWAAQQRFPIRAIPRRPNGCALKWLAHLQLALARPKIAFL